jgi:hypothetical protein
VTYLLLSGGGQGPRPCGRQRGRGGARGLLRAGEERRERRRWEGGARGGDPGGVEH